MDRLSFCKSASDARYINSLRILVAYIADVCMALMMYLNFPESLEAGVMEVK